MGLLRLVDLNVNEQLKKMFCAVSAFLLFGCSQPDIYVPSDFSTIQAAVDAADNGEVIFVAPGVYRETVVVKDKYVHLRAQASFLDNPITRDPAIIDGDGEAGLTFRNASGSSVRGFIIQNGNDGISTDSNISILFNKFKKNVDGIDYEGGGGICYGNIFENHRDDAIDLDLDVEVSILNNLIQYSKDDGIEIRLHPYEGDEISIFIENNQIEFSGENGIQLIDYEGYSSRKFYILRNVIVSSDDVGIGIMDQGETVEDYRAAPMPEPLIIGNNTIIGNLYGITGGVNAIVVNNIISNSEIIGIKGTVGDSVLSNNLFWANGLDTVDTNHSIHDVFADPLLDANYVLTSESNAIDKGAREASIGTELIYFIPSYSYSGYGVDIGANEFMP